MALKDAISGKRMRPVPKEHIKLTGPEHSANVLQMQQHREFRCARCLGRFDFDSGVYACLKEMNADWVMKNDKTCKKFSFNEDKNDWRDDI